MSLQVNELDSAVNRAAEQPQRFGLTLEEISSRRKWITSTRRQVCGCFGIACLDLQHLQDSSGSSLEGLQKDRHAAAIFSTY